MKDKMFENVFFNEKTVKCECQWKVILKTPMKKKLRNSRFQKKLLQIVLPSTEFQFSLDDQVHLNERFQSTEMLIFNILKKNSGNINYYIHG